MEPYAGSGAGSLDHGRYHARNGKQYHARINEYLTNLRVGSAIFSLGTYTNCQLTLYLGVEQSASAAAFNPFISAGIML